jgi:tRNA(Ile)-lysidine synthase
VGVSGGRDSVALLHWLLEGGIRNLVVCHLNHSLRGRESGGDAAFVRRLAKRHHLEFESAKTDVAKLADTRGISLETAGRVARHEFFAEVSRRRRCKRIVLGHHADDQAETVLMNLFRGSGTLSGMKPESELTVDGRKLELLRPLLGVTRDAIDTYATKHGIAFREDASNASDAFLRNRVRNELLPNLRRVFGRDVRKSVVRAAQLASTESELLDELLADFTLGTELKVRELRQLHPALQRRAIHRWLRARGVPDVGFEEVERVRAMLKDDAIAKVNLPAAMHARRRKGLLFLEPANARE